MSVVREALMMVPPLTMMPAGAAMMSSLRGPAISMLLLMRARLPLTWLTMMRALPVARNGLPCTMPAVWVLTLVRLLLRMSGLLTSNREYWFMETPAADGVMMLTWVAPLAVLVMMGRWLPGALPSATT